VASTPYLGCTTRCVPCASPRGHARTAVNGSCLLLQTSWRSTSLAPFPAALWCWARGWPTGAGTPREWPGLHPRWRCCRVRNLKGCIPSPSLRWCRKLWGRAGSIHPSCVPIGMRMRCVLRPHTPPLLAPSQAPICSLRCSHSTLCRAHAEPMGRPCASCRPTLRQIPARAAVLCLCLHTPTPPPPSSCPPPCVVSVTVAAGCGVVPHCLQRVVSMACLGWRDPTRFAVRVESEPP
jgi:hypothetical protein